MEMNKYKLGEIAKNITDGEHGTVIDDITGAYYLLSNKNIINGQILINPKTDRRINKETFDKINKRTKLEKGDVLISTVGTLGKTCIVEEKINYTLQRSVGIIKPNLDVLKSKYLMYLLMTDFYQNLLINNSKGAVQKCIFIDDLKQLPIQIPSLPTQQKIAAVLSSLDDKIVLNKKINAKLEAMAKQLYDYWFVQFDFPNGEGKPYKTSGGKMVWNEVLKRKIPEGWEVKKLGEIENNIITGKTPSTTDEENFGGDIPFVTIDDIRQSKYISKTERTLTEKGGKLQKNKFVPAKSLCCSCIGTIGVIGFTSIKSQTNQQINSIVFQNDKNTEYIYFSLKHFFSNATVKTGNVFSNMNKEEFSSILLILPPKEIINAFSEKTLPIFNYQLTIQKEIQKLTNLRDRLLPLLMNGQVEVEG